MSIAECYRSNKQTLSFEVFPPKKDADISKIYEVLREVAAIGPDFISVTYGASGKERSDKTVEIAANIERGFDIPALAHLTCIAATREEIGEILLKLRAKGIRNILALLGDPIKGGSAGSDYAYASDLIRHIRENYGDFSIGAAAYPEGHIRCEDFSEGIRHLRLKEEAGADFFITQLFFDNEVFYRFLDIARASGITKPISAGIMPILSRQQIERMIFMCGVSLPSRIIKLLYRYENDDGSLRQAGIEYAAVQARDLLRNGVDGIHIYTMNQPDIARIISSYVSARDFKQ
ncbi:MAG: methylenetetrahydrofolate reductase [NAD(P)H] [Fusobacteriaceae bacterium]|nr:methylenetetrahydrofolate reductase [NAD(P)H] [Fusobacteriaceae bacterium]